MKTNSRNSTLIASITIFFRRYIAMIHDMGLYIEINLDDEPKNGSSLADEINSLKPIKMKYNDEPPVILSNVPKKDKKKKKGKKSKLDGMFGIEEDTNDTQTDEKTDDESFSHELEKAIQRKLESDENIDENIIGEQKQGYKKLKKDSNDYKKEFAEELTLLYNLLDETSQFGKNLERTYSDIRSQKTRGISKYTNDLAELVLTSKQGKLNILKEIAAIKKTIADLKNKADAKDKKNGAGENNPEYLASAYFKNILSHGRTDFIHHLTNNSMGEEVQGYDDIVSDIVRSNNSSDFYDDPLDNTSLEDKFNRRLEERISTEGRGFRSAEGDKYIEYEDRGVKILVKKCIDTGEWHFIGVDKFGQEVPDYPVPSRRSVGRMKFSSDGTYCTDEKSRMYKVIEYYLPDSDDDD